MSVIYKKIPGSEKYRISLDREILDELNNVYFQGKSNVEIELFGIKKKVRKEWLVYLAWFEVDTIKNFNNDLENISFQYTSNTLLKTTTGVIPVFKKPILYNKKYRIVPSFPRYAVSIEGVIIDTFTNELIPPVYRLGSYPDVYIYSPDKSIFKTTKVHRLVALAWVSNDDYITRSVVNHLDSDKNNFHARNLEWTSLSENAQHSVDSGNNPSSIGMKIRDRVTKKIYVFNSASAMGKFLNKPTIAAEAFKYKLPGYLYAKRYEVKLITDETPWYYEDIPDGVVAGKECFTITVENTDDGSINLFNSVHALRKYLQSPTLDYSIDKVIMTARSRYPNLRITYKKNTLDGPYYLYDITNNSKQEFTSLKATSIAIGITKTELQYDLSRKLKYIYKGKYTVVNNNDTYDISNYIKKPGNDVKVEATEIVSGYIRSFMTLRGMVASLKLDKSEVIESIRNNTIYKGYKFRLT